METRAKADEKQLMELKFESRASNLMLELENNEKQRNYDLANYLELGRNLTMNVESL